MEEEPILLREISGWMTIKQKELLIVSPMEKVILIPLLDLKTPKPLPMDTKSQVPGPNTETGKELLEETGNHTETIEEEPIKFPILGQRKKKIITMLEESPEDGVKALLEVVEKTPLLLLGEKKVPMLIQATTMNLKTPMIIGPDIKTEETGSIRETEALREEELMPTQLPKELTMLMP